MVKKTIGVLPNISLTAVNLDGFEGSVNLELERTGDLSAESTCDVYVAFPIKFNSTESQKTLKFNSSGDANIVESGKFHVLLAAPDNAAIAYEFNQVLVATPNFPNIIFTDLVTNEALGQISVAVSLSSIPELPVSLSYESINNTAQAGLDYQAVAGVLNWAANDGGLKFIQINLINNAIVEADKEFNINFSAETNAILSKNTLKITIANDDLLPTSVLGISNATMTEGGFNTHHVVLSSNRGGSFNFSIGSGNATPLVDYQAPLFTNSVTLNNGMLTVPNGVSEFDITVFSVQDTALESTEVYIINLDGHVANGTINDDEIPPAVVNSISNSAGDEGTIITHTVVLSSNVGGVFAHVISGAVFNTDYSNVFFNPASVTLSAGNITVPAGISTFTESITTINNTGATANVNYQLSVGGVIGNGVITNTTAVPKPLKIGTNLPAAGYGSTFKPMVDLFKCVDDKRKYLDAASGATFDANGYMTKYPNNSPNGELFIMDAFQPSIQSAGFFIKPGTYVMLYEGATIEILYGVPPALINSAPNPLFNGVNRITLAEGLPTNVQQSPGRIQFDYNGTYPLWFKLFMINMANPLRNIRIVPIESEANYVAEPFESRAMELITGYNCLRFMPMQEINYNPSAKWAYRAKPTDATYGSQQKGGLPIETIIAMANKRNINPWLCIPHNANDDYITNMATLIKDNLNVNLKCYIEYSNEVWNFEQDATVYDYEANTYIYKQAQKNYATSQANALGLPTTANSVTPERFSAYQSYRHNQICAIFDTVFGASRATRIVRVLASQAGFNQRITDLLSYQNARQNADVLAVAPYVDFFVTPVSTSPLYVEIVKSWTVNQAFDYLVNVALPATIVRINNSRDRAVQFNIPLVAYEFGLQTLAFNGVEDNNHPSFQVIQNLITAINNDPRINTLVLTPLINAMADAGFVLANFYKAVDERTKFGDWGSTRNKYSPLATAYKHKALRDYANSGGQGIITV